MSIPFTYFELLVMRMGKCWLISEAIPEAEGSYFISTITEPRSSYCSRKVLFLGPILYLAIQRPKLRRTPYADYMERRSDRTRESLKTRYED